MELIAKLIEWKNGILQLKMQDISLHYNVDMTYLHITIVFLSIRINLLSFLSVSIFMNITISKKKIILNV